MAPPSDRHDFPNCKGLPLRAAELRLNELRDQGIFGVPARD